MTTIYDIKKRAQQLSEKTDAESISPAEVGGLFSDLADYANDVDVNGSSLGIRKTYTSVSAMEADKSPVGDDGKPLKKGQLVNIYNQDDPSSADNNKVFSWQNPGWQIRTTLDAGYATREELTELELKPRFTTDNKANDIIKELYITGLENYSNYYVYQVGKVKSGSNYWYGILIRDSSNSNFIFEYTEEQPTNDILIAKNGNVTVYAVIDYTQLSDNFTANITEESTQLKNCPIINAYLKTNDLQNEVNVVNTKLPFLSLKPRFTTDNKANDIIKELYITGLENYSNYYVYQVGKVKSGSNYWYGILIRDSSNSNFIFEYTEEQPTNDILIAKNGNVTVYAVIDYTQLSDNFTANITEESTQLKNCPIINAYLKTNDLQNEVNSHYIIPDKNDSFSQRYIIPNISDVNAGWHSGRTDCLTEKIEPNQKLIGKQYIYKDGNKDYLHIIVSATTRLEIPLDNSNKYVKQVQANNEKLIIELWGDSIFAGTTYVPESQSYDEWWNIRYTSEEDGENMIGGQLEKLLIEDGHTGVEVYDFASGGKTIPTLIEHANLKNNYRVCDIAVIMLGMNDTYAYAKSLGDGTDYYGYNTKENFRKQYRANIERIVSFVREKTSAKNIYICVPYPCIQKLLNAHVEYRTKSIPYFEICRQEIIDFCELNTYDIIRCDYAFREAENKEKTYTTDGIHPTTPVGAGIIAQYMRDIISYNL